MENKELTPEQIAGHLQAALAEVRACLPGRERTVSVGACEYTADDVRGFLTRMKKAEFACAYGYGFFKNVSGAILADDEVHTAKQKVLDALLEASKGGDREGEGE